MEKYYSPSQSAVELGLKYMQVIRRIRNKTIKAEKVGWGWIIPEEEIRRIKRHKDEAGKISY